MIGRNDDEQKSTIRCKEEGVKTKRKMLEYKSEKMVVREIKEGYKKRKKEGTFLPK